MSKCQNGEWSGVPCSFTGSDEDMVTVEFMPAWLRASHEAAGNWGAYPCNGAQRIRVCPTCAEEMLEYDPDWCRMIER